MSKESKKITIELSQLTVWRTGTVVFAVLFIIAVMTGGFGGNADSGAPSGVDTPTVPTAPAAPAERVKLDISDAPTLGDKKAPVTVVECSDYQCPYCNRAFTDTLPSLKKDYVDTGKVQYAFLDLALPFNQQAGPAAVAARCAGQQDNYWDMHDKLFANQGAWSGNADANSVFKGYAADIGLDAGTFERCLSDDSVAQAVQDDLAMCNNAGATGTPTFFINGVKLVGAQPYARFQALIDAELNN